MTQRGFTLMEMLMVIAIIGMLSTVVIASIRTAQLKGADSKIIQQARELRTIMALEFNETGSYAGIKSGGAWKGTGTSCNVANFTGNYATQADTICDALVTATGANCGLNCLSFNLPSGAANNDKFSIQVYLPSKNTYLCLGSSGASSQSAPADGTNWSFAGCQQNP